MGDIGKTLYDAYAKYQSDVNNCSVDSWENLDPREQDAWTAAAHSILWKAQD